jgi:HTH-type transcriptional regulator/antitoxin HigA
MRIKPIHTEEDYQEALNTVSRFFDDEPELGTPESDEFEILLTLIESYESKNFPIGLPDPIEAIKFRLEQSGRTIKDLSPMIGQMNRVYEVMNRKRALTLKMIRNLHLQLGVPAETLIMESTETKVVAGAYISRPRATKVGLGHAVKLSSGRKIAGRLSPRTQKSAA